LKFFIKIIFSALIIYTTLLRFAMGQTAFKSEADLKKNAEKLFDDQRYTEAFPLYSQLLALSQKDPNYNYRFGACMLYANEDKEKPMLYLKYAISKPDVEPEAFYFMGKASQLNYRFNDAIKNYEIYKTKKAGKPNPKYDVQRGIETCNNGKNLIQKPTELVVLEKKDVVTSDFFRSYSLQGINGKLVVKPEDFCSKIDLKRKDASIMYISPDDKYLYYSSWGDNEKNSRDIYRVQKLASGGFGVPENLGTNINTPYDEEYAFMHPDGKTLYFCSKGHNSMGGYDVFKAVYDEANNGWGKAENVDFPINSPDDDMLYLTDAEYKNSYFSSKRGSKLNYTKVYKIKEGIKTDVLVMLAGTFVQAANNNTASATVSVRKMDEDKKLVGIFKTNNASKYMINLPAGGKYQFTVESIGKTVQNSYVDVPLVKEYTAYKQQITYEDKGDKKDIVAIKSEFDTPLTAGELQEILKNQAELDVNFDADIDRKILLETNNGIKTQQDNTAVATDNTVKEDINETINKAVNAGKDADEAKQNSNAATVFAYLRAKEAAELQQKLNELQLKESSATTTTEKEALAIELATTKQSLIASINDVDAAKKVSAEQAQIAQNKQAEADNIMAYAKAYDAAKGVQSPDLSALKTKANLTNTLIANDATEKEDAENKQAYNENIKQQQEIKKDIAENKAEQENLKGQIARTKDKTIKAAFQAQIDDLNQDIEAKEAELPMLQVKGDKLKAKLKANDANGKNDILIRANEAMATLPVKPAVDNVEINRIMAQVNTTIASDQNTSNNNSNTTTTVNIIPQANTNTTTVTGSDNNTPNTTTTNPIITNSIVKEYSPEIQAKVYVKDADIALQKTEAIVDVDIRKKEKVKTYKELDAMLVDEINTLKEKQQSTKIVADKNIINAEIAELTQLKQDVNEKISAVVASQSNEVAITPSALNTTTDSTIMVSNSVPNNTDNVTTTINSPQAKADDIVNGDNSYPEKINELSKIEDVTVRENAKIKVNETFVAKLNNDIATNKAEIKKARSAEEKNKLETEIAAYENVKKQKAKDISESKKIVALQPNTTATNVSLTNTTDNTTANVNVTTSNTETNTDNTTTTDNTNTATTTNNPSNSTTTNVDAIKDNTNTATNTNNPSNSTTTNVDTVKDNTNTATTATTANNPSNSTKINVDAIKDNSDTTTTNNPSNSTTINVDAIKDNSDTSTANNPSNSTTTNADAIKDNTNTSTTGTTTNNTTENAYNLLTTKPNNIAQDLVPVADKTATVSYTNTDVREELTRASNTYDTYKQKNKEAAALNLQAKNNPQQKTMLTLKADAARTEAKQKQSEYNEQLFAANKLEYDLNKYTNASFKNNYEQSTNSKVLAADMLNDEAESYYDQAKKIRAIASGTKDITTKLDAQSRAYELEAKAITKQQQSVATYIAINTNDAQKITNTAKLNYKNAPALSAININNTTSSSVNTATLPDAETNNTNVTTTETYKELVATKDEAKALENNATKQEQKATQQNERANKNQQEADKIIMQANATDDAQERQKLFEKADSLNSIIAKERDLASVNKTAANNYKNEASAKENEANTLLQSIDKTNYEKNNPAESSTTITPTIQPTTAKETLPTVKGVASNNPVMLSSEIVSGGDANTNKTKSATTIVKKETSATDVVNAKLIVDTIANQPASANKIIEAASNTKTPSNDASTVIKKETSTVLTNDVFEKKSTIIYTTTNPIPLNPPMPQGLVFKVQVGAFRNPIPQDLFKGFNPLAGESTPSGLVRYTAGSFRNYKNANLAKTEIRGIGYKDAFVVAYYNGKRISYAEAMTLVSENSASASALEPTSVLELKEFVRNAPIANTSNTPNVNSTTASTIKIDSATTVVNTNPTINVTNDIKSVEVTSLQGLAYTVQVGVYGKKVTSAQLFNIQPLNVETTSNNYLRYSSGLYNDANEATKAKNIIVGYGIKDAFVTAYYNGKRISTTEAKQLLADQGAKVYIQSPSINAMPSQK
jgi:epidermal growth factor receptor substrate 15